MTAKEHLHEVKNSWRKSFGEIAFATLESHQRKAGHRNGFEEHLHTRNISMLLWSFVDGTDHGGVLRDCTVW